MVREVGGFMKILMILLGLGTISYALDISYPLICSIYLGFLIVMAIRAMGKEFKKIVDEEIRKEKEGEKEIIGGYVVKKTDPDSEEYLSKYMPH